jgi:nitrous oxide reductase accessory protein NosL
MGSDAIYDPFPIHLCANPEGKFMFENNVGGINRLFVMVSIFASVLLAGCAAGVPAQGDTHKDHGASGKTPAVEHPMKTPKIYSKEIKAATADTRCVVCNMKVANYPEHDCQILLEDNSSIHFCSTQCLINYLADPGQYVDKPAASKMTWVKVFPSGDYESAIGLYYVVGSNLFGPMGREAIPFRSKKVAEALVSKEGGEIVRFNGLTPQMVAN